MTLEDSLQYSVSQNTKGCTEHRLFTIRNSFFGDERRQSFMQYCFVELSLKLSREWYSFLWLIHKLNCHYIEP